MNPPEPARRFRVNLGAAAEPLEDLPFVCAVNGVCLPWVISLDTNPVYNKRDLPALFLAHPAQHFTCGACHSTVWGPVSLKSSASFLPECYFLKFVQKTRKDTCFFYNQKLLLCC